MHGFRLITVQTNEVWLYLEKIVVLIWLSKHIRQYFQVTIAFEHSAFIASKLLFLPTNMALKRYLACPTFSKCRSYSNERCLVKRTYTLSVVKSYKIDADNQLHNCVCGARCLSRWRCYKYSCNVTTEKNDWIAIALSPLHCHAKVKKLKSI